MQQPWLPSPPPPPRPSPTHPQASVQCHSFSCVCKVGFFADGISTSHHASLFLLLLLLRPDSWQPRQLQQLFVVATFVTVMTRKTSPSLCGRHPPPPPSFSPPLKRRCCCHVIFLVFCGERTCRCHAPNFPSSFHVFFF